MKEKQYGIDIEETLGSAAVAAPKRTMASNVDRRMAAVIETGRVQNLELLARRKGEGAFAEMISDFLDNTSRRVDELSRAVLEVKDRKAARQAAHAIKGNCATFGAPRLSELGASIEQAVAGDGWPSTTQLEELAEQAAAVSAYFRTHYL